MKESSKSLNNQGIILAQSGDFKEAIACFKKAISLENFNYRLWFNLGITYRDAGQTQNAVHALEKAFQLNDSSQDVIESLSAICFELGLLEESKTYCNYGLDIQPLNSHLWNNLGVVEFNMENYEAACESFECAVSINPYYKDAIFNLKDTYSELKNETGMKECQAKLDELR